MSDLPTSYDPELAQQVSKYKLDRLPGLAYLHDATPERGLIPASSIRPPDGQVESSTNVEMMQRVAKALVRPMTISDPTAAPSGKRDATTLERLASCGCPPEVYDQLTRHPEFKTIFMTIMEQYILLPSLPDAMRAAKVKAGEGSKDHLQQMRDMLRLGENPTEDGIREQLASLDDVAFEREMREYLEKNADLYGQLVKPRVTRSLTDEVLASEELPEKPEDEQKIDHAKVHGDATD